MRAKEGLATPQSCGRLQLHADKHWFVDQHHAENFPHCFPDLTGERHQSSRGGAARIGERERVLGGNPRAKGRVSLAKTSLLDQPCGRDLDLPIRRREARELYAFAHPAAHRVLKRRELSWPKRWVGEEGACTVGVRVRRIEHHSLTAAQREHRVAYLTKRRPLPRRHAKR